MRFVCWLAFASLLFLSCAPERRSQQAAPVAAGQAHVQLPGPKSDGSVLLPNQWSLRPAGKQIELRDFPLSMSLHPGGRYIAVMHCGYSAQQISIVDLQLGRAISHANIDQGFYGLEFSRDGKQLYCSGAGAEVIHAFDFESGSLKNHREFRLHDENLRAIPAGIAVDSSARTIYAANVWGDRLSRLDLTRPTHPLDIPLRTNTGPLLVIPPEHTAPDEDTEAAMKRAFVVLLQADPNDTFPYACKLDEKRNRLYVSLWAQSKVAVVDTKSNQVIARWPTEEHPCEMVLSASGKYLFVANANRNTVSVLDTGSGHTIETIWAALYPDSPPGATPNSLALSRDGTLLFVANANLNAVAVFDVSIPGKSRSLGFIPTGWYPTAVRVSIDGKKLLVLNGKGVLPKANPNGPQPGVNYSTNLTIEYIARLFRGTLSVIDLPSRKKFEPEMKDYTARAYLCSPLKKSGSSQPLRPPNNPIPAKPGAPCPIKYVFYIIKENRTYDQVLGDLRQGNGDPQLCLFPERVTPNGHKLAKEFVLLDNFYADAEISADGHEWSMGAYATDFVEKMWPITYGHNNPRKFPYPAEGNFPIASPANGYLWDAARRSGVSYRSYGEFVELYRGTNGPVTTRVKALKNHIDEWYRGFDLELWDTNRAARLISEIKRFEKEGNMPRLQIVRLPNDHTHAATPGWRTPSAYVADNDLALGQIIEGISHSKFWPETAVFVVEDDAQNGPDHVDAHRTVAFAISPYIKRATVDSTMYSTCSMLHTIELILGFSPMSQFDAAATPMFNSFQTEPDLTPYTAEAARVDLAEKNGSQAWGGKIKMNFAREDAVDDLLLNEVIWRSVRGPKDKMPGPVRAGFVIPLPSEDD